MNDASVEGIPADWTLVLDPRTRRTDGGRVLIGGAPLRVMTLTEGGASWLDGIVAGQPVGPSRGERALARRLIEAGAAHPCPAAGVGPSLADVAVVIPVRDMAEGLATTLATIGDVGEIIVVDDGSRDPAALRATASGDGQGQRPTLSITRSVTVLRNDVSEGPAAARERGWRSTDSPFVVFVDAEIDAEAGWIERLLPHFADDTVAAVAPRVRARTAGAPEWLATYEAARSPLDLGPDPSPVRPGASVSYVPTAALIVRRRDLELIDGFDRDMRVGEDVDLVWRLYERGWSVRYDPSVEVTHPTRPTFRALIQQRVAYGTSAAGLAQRHGDAVAPLRVSGWSALMWSLLLAGRPLLGAGVGIGTTAALIPKLSGLQHPAREAWQIAGKGHAWSAMNVAEAIRRPWWPVAIAVAIASRRSRLAVVAALALPAIIDAQRATPGCSWARFAALRLIDDTAYGVGVWIGCVRARSARALLPAPTGPVNTSL